MEAYGREIRKKNFSSTPYDDVFKTLMIKGGSLVIPFVNELFHPRRSIAIDATIVSGGNEHFLDIGDGRQVRLLTDSVILIDGIPYHIECQSRDDGTILVRIACYDWLIAMERSYLEGNHLIIPLPESGLLYLRKTAATPEKMSVEYRDSCGHSLEYEVHVSCLADYSLEELFEKNLTILLPFYLFNLEHELKKFSSDEEAEEKVTGQFTELLNYLNEQYENGSLSMEHYLLITDMLKKVTDNLAKKEETARKELDRIMGGKVLEFRGEKIYNQGREKGRAEGWAEGKAEGKDIGRIEGADEKAIQVYKNCIARGMSRVDAIAISEISEEALASIDEKR